MPPSKADRPFWIAGGEDREAAEACRLYPDHRWQEFAVGQMLVDELVATIGIDPSETLTLCNVCLVPRCRALATTRKGLTEDRCIRAMNHRERFHRFAGHPAEPVVQVPAHAR